MWDSSSPGANPAQADCLAFYIGGDTPHVWTLPEIEAAQGTQERLPIYVRSFGFGNPLADANDCIARLKTIGQPIGTTVALDLETAIALAYTTTFNQVVSGLGYYVLLYGSTGTLFKNPITSGGYWAADPSGAAHMYPGSVETQWKFAGAYDLSLVDDSVKLWTPNAPIPSPVYIPPPQPSPLPPAPTVVHITVPLVTITKVQSECNVHGAHITVDGIWGPNTDNAVRAFQRSVNIAADGIVGPVTWDKFINTVPRKPYPGALLQVGDRGQNVLAVQQAVGAPADGIFGLATKGLVQRWQRARGLQADGIVGPATWAKMFG